MGVFDVMWDLSEFFKDKKDCLNEINGLNKIYDKILLFKDYDMSIDDNLFCFLKFLDKYQDLIYEFQSYIDLLETSDYHNSDYITINMRFKMITEKIDGVIFDIADSIDFSIIDKYKDNDNYLKYFQIIESFNNSKEDEVSRTYNAFSRLMSDLEAQNGNIISFKHTFLELINNYFNGLKDSIDISYDDYVFNYHPEITKEDFKFLTNNIKKNSIINRKNFSVASEYVPKNLSVKYENAKEYVKSSLEPFGDEYLGVLNSTLDGDAIDYKSRKYKSKGNMTYMIKNHRAFANINYDNTLNSTFTLAHEVGHMLEHNFKFKHNKTSALETGPTSELFSLTNELMLGYSMLERANSLDEKISISSELIDLYYNNLFEAIGSSDLSLLIGNKIWKDSYIDLKGITSLNNKVINKYNLYNDKGRWISLDVLEFLDVIYYVYGIIGASSVYSSIRDKSFSKRDFLEVLKNNFVGFDAYNKLGCNPLNEDVIKSVFSDYNNLLDNTRDLISEKKLRR